MIDWRKWQKLLAGLRNCHGSSETGREKAKNRKKIAGKDRYYGGDNAYDFRGGGKAASQVK